MHNTATGPSTIPSAVDETAAGRGDGSRPAPSSSRVVAIMDRAAARLLRVEPQQGFTTDRQRPLDTPLLLVGVRCIARYIVLPFVLPLLAAATGAARGIVTGVGLGILVVLDIVAVISIVTTLRWLWQRQHPRRWQYLPVALALTALIALFLVNDTQMLAP